MRMLCPCQCRHSTEDLELGEWHDCGRGCGESRAGCSRGPGPDRALCLDVMPKL